MPMDSVDRSRAPLLAVIGILVAGILIVGLALMAVFGVGLFQKETAGFRGSVEATEIIQGDGTYRIAAYDQFFNRCSEIQAKEATLDALKSERDTTSPSESRLHEINATITAVTAARASDIARYNTDAAKAGTIAQFKSSTLPFSIDVTQENTTCVIR